MPDLQRTNCPTRCHAARPPPTRSVYTKLYVFGLEAYSRLIYLDADTVVKKNIDHLFRCGAFCAVLRHSERFNSGVMVLTPSTALLKDMLGRTGRTPSYTGRVGVADLLSCPACASSAVRLIDEADRRFMVAGPRSCTSTDDTPLRRRGDQGFLNEYIAGLANSSIFDDGSGVGSSTASTAGGIGGGGQAGDSAAAAETAEEGEAAAELQWAEGVALTVAAAASRRDAATATEDGSAATMGALSSSLAARGMQLRRLPTRYNADVGLFVLNSWRWMIPAESIHVMCAPPAAAPPSLLDFTLRA